MGLEVTNPKTNPRPWYKLVNLQLQFPLLLSLSFPFRTHRLPRNKKEKRKSTKSPRIYQTPIKSPPQSPKSPSLTPSSLYLSSHFFPIFDSLQVFSLSCAVLCFQGFEFSRVFDLCLLTKLLTIFTDLKVFFFLVLSSVYFSFLQAGIRVSLMCGYFGPICLFVQRFESMVLLRKNLDS